MKHKTKIAINFVRITLTFEMNWIIKIVYRNSAKT
jgi:hypothetical protein